MYILTFLEKNPPIHVELCDLKAVLVYLPVSTIKHAAQKLLSNWSPRDVLVLNWIMSHINDESVIGQQIRGHILTYMVNKFTILLNE